MKIPAERIYSFIDKWELIPENDNPMVVNISPEIILNGKTIPCSNSCSLSWNPCFPEYNDTESKPKMRSLSIIIKHDPVPISDLHFSAGTPGEYIDFTNPITNALHRLTVREYERQEIQTDTFCDTDYDFPSHFVSMSYTIIPEIDDANISVSDCSTDDRPRKKQRDPVDRQPDGNCCAVGIIGGQGKFRSAYSSLHFEPVNTIQWKVVFYETPCEDITLEIK